MSDLDPLKTRGLWKHLVKRTKQLSDMKKAAEKEEKRQFHQRKRAEIQKNKKVAFQSDTPAEETEKVQPRKKVLKKAKKSIFWKHGLTCTGHFLFCFREVCSREKNNPNSTQT